MQDCDKQLCPGPSASLMSPTTVSNADADPTVGNRPLLQVRNRRELPPQLCEDRPRHSDVGLPLPARRKVPVLIKFFGSIGLDVQLSRTTWTGN